MGGDQTRSRADGCDDAAPFVVVDHHLHQFFIFGQDLRAGHAARKDQTVAGVEFFGFAAENAESGVRDDLHVVRSGDVELVGNGNQFSGYATPAKDIEGGKGFGLLETIGQKDVSVVHGNKKS